MSYLFFIDESGHDHRNCPYEVRGGIVIHASKLWSFIQQFRDLEIAAFGVELAEFKCRTQRKSPFGKEEIQICQSRRSLG
jgi:hypothetical protein